MSYFKRRSLMMALVVASSGFLAKGVLLTFQQTSLDSSLSYLTLFLLSVLALVVLCDRVVFYLLATAQASIGQYHFPKTSLTEMLTVSGRLSRPSSIRGLQILGVLLLAGFILLRVLPPRSSIYALGTSDAMVIFFLLCLVATAGHLLIAAETQNRSLKRIARAVLSAFGHWAFHNPHPTAHGVFRAAWPYDAMINRFIMLLLVCSMLVGSMSVAASFFPATLRNPNGWLTLDEEVPQETFNGSEITGPSSNEEVLMMLQERPDNWIQLSFLGFRQGKPFFALSLFLGLALSVLLPLGVFVSLGLLVSAPMIVAIADTWEEAVERAEGTAWDTKIKLIQSSTNPHERDSLLIGYHTEAGYPVLLPRRTLEEHCHILGDSGSGKTALGLMPMMTQLVRLAGRDLKDPNSFRSSVVVMDLKGDQALFQTAKREAEDAGLPFRWFNIEYGRATHVFNPFLQGHVAKLSRAQWTQVLTEALSLAHGEGYGRGFFGSINQEVLGAMLEAHPTRIQSFRELYEFTTDKKFDLLGKKLGVSKKKQEDAGELFAAIRKLAAIANDHVTPAGNDH